MKSMFFVDRSVCCDGAGRDACFPTDRAEGRARGRDGTAAMADLSGGEIPYMI